MTNRGIEIEQLPDHTWIWIHQTVRGGFYRAPHGYTTKTAARKAGQEWLTRRANPRNRGR
jgi:hypothetical protein